MIPLRVLRIHAPSTPQNLTMNFPSPYFTQTTTTTTTDKHNILYSHIKPTHIQQ